ncbi:ATP-binding protein [Patescibacteria group bacterium]|nr:ATP-binding protein [Patescibacteria group bacterium]MBU4099277.1 ATP-binding protein [Patescibacteria group bacterium]
MDTDIKYIKRDLEAILKEHLNKHKIIVLYGARQVGKTTLTKKLFPSEADYLYLSCDQSRIQEQIIPDKLALGRIVGDYTNIVFDEAQYLKNPGLVLKILIDSFPEKNIIATGSSSFDLAHKLSEPLTGRHYKLLLFPLSLAEIAHSVPPTDVRFHLEQALIFGTYPEVFKLKTNEEKILNLQTLTDSYLYKDILAFNLVKNNQKVKELLIAIALQIGNEVSYSELANTIGIDRKTVEYYLDLLEKSFVLFRLYGFSRNLRSEINRKVKIYFYDVGIRNTLINNFNELALRTDGGALFENFVVSEMLKKETNKPQKANLYFWRTYEQKEIDLISEKNSVITAYEMKLNKSKKISGFAPFQKLYPESTTKVITLDTLLQEPLLI